MKNFTWARKYSDAQIEACLKGADLQFRKLDRQALLDAAAGADCCGNIVGWFQGQGPIGTRGRWGTGRLWRTPGLPTMKDMLNAALNSASGFGHLRRRFWRTGQNEYFEHDHPSPSCCMFTRFVREACGDVCGEPRGRYGAAANGNSRGESALL